MKYNLENDLKSSESITQKIQESEEYRYALYAALCNNEFVKFNDRSITWSCSWRHSGSIVASIYGAGDYMDYFCSGMFSQYDDSYECLDRITEGVISEEIQTDLVKLGWIPITQQKRE